MLLLWYKTLVLKFESFKKPNCLLHLKCLIQYFREV